MFGKLMTAGKNMAAQAAAPQAKPDPNKPAQKADLRASLTSMMQSGEVKNLLSGLNPQQQKDVIDQTAAKLETGSELPTSTCTGNKKSLFIGINYVGSKSELRGCWEDVRNIKTFVTDNFKFPSDAAHQRVLMDDSQDAAKLPTRENVLAAMKWLVEGAKDGDSLFFHYSGHGTSVPDTDGDEIDGNDEALVPVDYEKAGMLVDDLIWEILVKNLPKGVRLTAIMDCCHSGSMFDLPFSYNPDGTIGSQEIAVVDNRKEAIKAAVKAGNLLFAGDKQGALKEAQNAVKLFVTSPAPGKTTEAGQKVMQIKDTLGDVIQFSGCRDDQTSADAVIDAKPQGACSAAFISSYKPGIDYVVLLGAIRDYLKGKYTQVPQLSAGRKLDLRTKFFM